MTVYFDKANLEAFLRTEGQPGYAEALKMLRREVNVRVNFSMLDALAPGPSKDVLKKFVGYMAVKGGATNFNFLPASFPERPISPSFYAQPQSLKRPVVLAADEELAACKAKSTCLIGEVGTELPELGRLHRGDTGKYMQLLTVGEERGQFSDWSQLSAYVLPFHDLIIHDRYLLKHPIPFRHNYPRLIKALIQGRRGKLNIVLLTLKPDDREADFISYSELLELTEETVLAETGITPNFTVVWGETGDDVRHDRHIFTNYQWFDSRDSFTYFKRNNDLKSKSDTLTVHSLADAEFRAHADELIKRIQERVDDIIRDSSLIDGDRVSSFLTF